MRRRRRLGRGLFHVPIPDVTCMQLPIATCSSGFAINTDAIANANANTKSVRICRNIIVSEASSDSSSVIGCDGLCRDALALLVELCLLSLLLPTALLRVLVPPRELFLSWLYPLKLAAPHYGSWLAIVSYFASSLQLDPVQPFQVPTLVPLPILLVVAVAVATSRNRDTSSRPFWAFVSLTKSEYLLPDFKIYTNFLFCSCQPMFALTGLYPVDARKRCCEMNTKRKE